MTRSSCSFIAAAALLAFTPLTGLAENPSPGCGENGWRSGTYEMDFDGISRAFRVHVPRGYDNSTPMALVMLFHGWGGNENAFIGNRKVRSEADKRGYILVAPRGLGSGNPDYSNNSWRFSGSDTGLDGDESNPDAQIPICDFNITPDYAYPSCADVKSNSCSWTHCRQSDVEYVVDLVGKVGENLCIDEDRVFAMGGSNGGMFSWELGQNRLSAPKFRAIAPLIGLPHRAYLDPPAKLEGEGDLPAIVITGTRDNVVPPGEWEDPGFTTTSNGSDRYYYTGATAITEVWSAWHGCSIGGNAARTDIGGRKVDCRTYCSGDAGWPRVLDCRARMGHSYGLSWSWKLILDFFDAHSN